MVGRLARLRILTRMTNTGYSLVSTWSLTKRLEIAGFVEHLEKKVAYCITPLGRPALDGLVFRATTV